MSKNPQFPLQSDGVPICDPYDYHLRSLCKDLWIGVLHQCIADAFFPIKNTRNSRGERRTIISEEDVYSAREWLMSDSKDFRQVCAWAGFEAEDVRRRSLVWDKLNWPTRTYTILRTRLINQRERY